MKPYLLLLMLPLVAAAQETLSYQSGPITSIEISGPPQFAPQVLGEDITGIIMLNQALPANGTTTVSDSGLFGFDGNNQFAIEASFTFTTANNAVVSFSDSGATPGGSEAFASLSGASSSNSASFGYGTPEGGYTAEASAGGWVDPPSLAAPEVNSSGAAAAITLLLGVLAITRRSLWHSRQSSN